MMSNRHRTFSITHTLADRYFGGIERYVLDLGEELRERGNSISFILSSKSPVLEYIRAREFPFVALPVNSDIDLRIAWRVAAALRRFKPDLVNIHDSPAIVPYCLGARMAHLPIVTTVHAFHQKWGFLLADHLVTVSEALRRHMLAQGFREHQITAVRSGIDVATFQPRNRPEAQSELGCAAVVLFRGDLPPGATQRAANVAGGLSKSPPPRAARAATPRRRRAAGG